VELIEFDLMNPNLVKIVQFNVDRYARSKPTPSLLKTPSKTAPEHPDSNKSRPSPTSAKFADSSC
jgi:hypothetical protein